MKTIKELLTDVGTYIGIYILMYINTFGHAWVNISSDPRANDLGIMIGSMACAFLWPLYWSVKFWS